MLNPFTFNTYIIYMVKLNFINKKWELFSQLFSIRSIHSGNRASYSSIKLDTVLAPTTRATILAGFQLSVLHFLQSGCGTLVCVCGAAMCARYVSKLHIYLDLSHAEI